MPLRKSLPLLTAGLVGLALLIAGILATTAMREYLVDQVDSNLLRAPTPTVAPPPPEPVERQSPLSSELFIQFRDDSGAVVDQLSNLPEGLEAPQLPQLTRAEVIATGGRPFTVGDWRVRAVTAPNGTVMVARSLAGVQATVRRLVGLQIAVGVLVLAAVAGLSTLAVRRSLRPLQRVEKTAVAITAGDLNRRVTDVRPGTEAGDVGEALNSMLDRLQKSFDQRQQALDDAQASEARMRQFVADASHELRTPLTGVRGTAELYRQGAIPDGDVASAFGRVESESQRMGLLVDELLLLARLDAHRPLDMRRVDLLDVCAESVTSFPGAPVSLVIRQGSSAPIVQADARRLRQVVDNLISNGLQHGSGQVTVTVGTQGANAVVSVSDEGDGVSDDEAVKVFDRFYRSGGDRSRTTGGSGLGLSIVASLVAAHGGSVTVAGATFTVYVPLVD